MYDGVASAPPPLVPRERGACRRVGIEAASGFWGPGRDGISAAASEWWNGGAADGAAAVLRGGGGDGPKPPSPVEPDAVGGVVCRFGWPEPAYIADSCSMRFARARRASSRDVGRPGVPEPDDDVPGRDAYIFWTPKMPKLLPASSREPGRPPLPLLRAVGAPSPPLASPGGGGGGGCGAGGDAPSSSSSSSSSSPAAAAAARGRGAAPAMRPRASAMYASWSAARPASLYASGPSATPPSAVRSVAPQPDAAAAGRAGGPSAAAAHALGDPASDSCIAAMSSWSSASENSPEPM